MHAYLGLEFGPLLINPEKKDMSFSLSILLGSVFDGVEEAKKKYRLYVEKGFRVNPLKTNDEGSVDTKASTKKSSRYIDGMPTHDHLVFVSDKKIKNFGHYKGNNDKGVALVMLHNGVGQTPNAFPAQLVISM